MRSLSFGDEDEARETLRGWLSDLVRFRKIREDAERRVRAVSSMIDGITTMFPALRDELPDDFEPPKPRRPRPRAPR